MQQVTASAVGAVRLGTWLKRKIVSIVGSSCITQQRAHPYNRKLLSTCQPSPQAVLGSVEHGARRRCRACIVTTRIRPCCPQQAEPPCYVPGAESLVLACHAHGSSTVEPTACTASSEVAAAAAPAAVYPVVPAPSSACRGSCVSAAEGQPPVSRSRSYFGIADMSGLSEECRSIALRCMGRLAASGPGEGDAAFCRWLHTIPAPPDRRSDARRPPTS